MITINLLDWDVTYTELAQWANDTGAEVYAVTGPGMKYKMSEKDLVAFKLTFKRGCSSLVGYKGITTVDTAMYYCPYIPLLKNEIQDTET